MKSYLHAIVLMGLLFYAPNLWAQCEVTNPIVSNIVRPASCNSVTFDLDFTMNNNNGNKLVVIHLWPANQHPDISYNKPPDASQLATSFGTIVIDNSTSPKAYIDYYPFSSGVHMLLPDGLNVSGGTTSTTPFQFHISGITIPVNDCSSAVDVMADIWSTNSGSTNDKTNPQCFTKNVGFTIGEIGISAPFKTCGDPRYVNFSITTTIQSPINVTYKIYKDDGLAPVGEPVFDPNKDLNVTLSGSATATIASGEPYIAKNIGFVGNNTPGEDYEYWIVVNYSDGLISYGTAKLTTSACAPLPVKFSDFTATRSKNTVLLKWQTATESNNRGFYVQRLLGSGEWKNIAYVFSAADHGNSTSLLNYKYTDINEYSGLTQYRIVQQDIDYRMHYSEIRAVRGESNQSGILVFPNPSQDGKVMLVFGEPGIARDLTVTDLSGRTIKVMRAVTNNTVTLTGLVSGVYTVHVTNLANATTTVEKIVVAKR